MHAYYLKHIPNGRRDVVEAMAGKFFGEETEVNEAPLIDEYVIYSTRSLSEEQREKLEQLCRLSARETEPPPPPPPPPPPQAITPRVDVEKQTAPPIPPTKNKPDTLRVKRIPNNLAKGDVAAQVSKRFNRHAHIHSLVASSSEYNSATVTFPQETDYGFLEKKLLSLRNDSGSFEDEFEYDVDFHSLTPLYDAGEDAAVDIIAVAGLGTHAFATFRSPEAGRSDMWLRDYLPQDIKSARIVLYGYPSRVDASKSVEKIEDIARQFLERLINFRQHTKTQNRPIVFLGQSLGGLVVQECLVLSDPAYSRPWQNEQSKADAELIFNSWYGLVGFGNPMAGLNNPSLLTAVRNQPNQALIQEICVDENGEASDYLKSLKTRFETCRQRRSAQWQPRITYFWESLLSVPRERGGIVHENILMVTEDFETPGAQNIQLHSDHSGMVKYKSMADLLYEDVRDNMKTMIEAIIARTEEVNEQKGRKPGPSKMVQQSKGDKVNAKNRKRRVHNGKENF